MSNTPVWDKPRPKGLGKSHKLSAKQKAKAKAAAKAAGRPYPNLIDNMRAARAFGGMAYGQEMATMGMKKGGRAELQLGGVPPNTPTAMPNPASTASNPALASTNQPPMPMAQPPLPPNTNAAMMPPPPTFVPKLAPMLQQTGGENALNTPANHMGVSEEGYAHGGEVEDALRLARGPHAIRLHQAIARHGYATDGAVKGGASETSEEKPDYEKASKFEQQELKGSAPQYEPYYDQRIAPVGRAAMNAVKYTQLGGMANAAGMMDEPSIVQNIRQGNYGPAALQAAAVAIPSAAAAKQGPRALYELSKIDKSVGMPGYAAYKTAEDWVPSVLGNEGWKAAKDLGSNAVEAARQAVGYARGGTTPSPQGDQLIKQQQSETPSSSSGFQTTPNRQHQISPEEYKKGNTQKYEYVMAKGGSIHPDVDSALRVAHRAHFRSGGVRQVNPNMDYSNSMRTYYDLINSGHSPEAAAGMVGNFMVESSNKAGNKLSFGETERGVKSGTGGAGIAQWTGSRRQDFQNFAKQQGMDWRSPEANTAFFKHEAEKNPWVGKQVEKVEAQPTAGAAAETAAKQYFRPRADALRNTLGARVGYAQNVADIANKGNPFGGTALAQQSERANMFAKQQQPEAQVTPASLPKADTQVSPAEQTPQASTATPSPTTTSVDNSASNQPPMNFAAPQQPAPVTAPNEESTQNFLKSQMNAPEQKDESEPVAKPMNAQGPEVPEATETQAEAPEQTDNNMDMADNTGLDMPDIDMAADGGVIKPHYEDDESELSRRLLKHALHLASGGGAWTRKEGKNPNGGLNAKGRASLKAQGHDIKRPQPEGGSRRDSFCARMKGMKAKLTSAKTANDPDSRINKSLRAWNCHADGGQIRDALQVASKRLHREEGGLNNIDQTESENPVKKNSQLDNNEIRPMSDASAFEQQVLNTGEKQLPQSDVAAGEHTLKQAGLFGAGMAPGAGIATAAGKFPTAEGGYEPSMKEDWQAGRYGSAALKGLGAAGDVASVAPVVGTAAGAALKAPLAMKMAMAAAPALRTAKTAIKGADEVSDALKSADQVTKMTKAAKAEQAAKAEEAARVAAANQAAENARIAKETKGAVDTGNLQGPVRYPGGPEDFDKVPLVTDETLRGKSHFPIFADLTKAGSPFTGIDAAGTAKPQPAYGGPLYPLLYENQLANLGWAVRGKGRGTAKVSKPTDYATVLAMSPDTHKSNTTFGNSLINTMEAYAKDNRLSPENLQALNQKVRDIGAGKQKELASLKEFPGFEHPDAPEYVDKLSFEARKALVDQLGNPTGQELGAPNMKKMLNELMDPRFHGYNRHDAMLLLELSKHPGEGLVNLSEAGLPVHPDYPYGIHGRVVGRYAPGVSGKTLFPDYFAEKSAKEAQLTEAARAEGKPDPRFGQERSFEMALPIQKFGPNISNSLDLSETGLQSPQAARLALNSINDAWSHTGSSVKEGGLSPTDFARAIQESPSSSTLTKYDPAELKKMIKQGKFEAHKLNDGEVYFGLEHGKDYNKEYGFSHPELTPNEIALTSVVNNEPGANGIGGPSVMHRALQRGATALDAFAVPTAQHPEGFLPQYYSKYGFKELGRIPFDPQYYNKNQLADMEKLWESQGWDRSKGHPSVAIMKYAGDENARAEGLRRHIEQGSASYGKGSGVLAAAGASEHAGQVPGGVAGKKGQPKQSVGRGDNGPNQSNAPLHADKFSQSASRAIQMSPEMAERFGLNYSDVEAARKKILGYSFGGIAKNNSTIRDAVELAKNRIANKYR